MPGKVQQSKVKVQAGDAVAPLPDMVRPHLERVSDAAVVYRTHL